MMSKAELSRAAKVSPITISRIENGMPCRVETKRKLLIALGMKLSERDKVFGNYGNPLAREAQLAEKSIGG